MGTAQSGRRRGVRTRIAAIAGLLLVVVVAAELGARIVLGLGDPVLYVTHPTIEYMLRPNQEVYRLGNRIAVNAYGMRSPPFAERKNEPREMRVLVMGDSVVNGGNLTDQARLATTLLAQRLTRQTGRPAVVGNVSAGSWGPQNMLAWTQTYGLLDADCVVVVLSSHDAADVPTFAALDERLHPTKKPPSGLHEGFVRYAPRYLTVLRTAEPAEPVPVSEAPRAEAINAVRELFLKIRDAGAGASLVQHYTRSQLGSEPAAGYTAIGAIAAELQIPRVDDREILNRAEQGSASPYRDEIHPNDRGQMLLAESLYRAVQPCVMQSQ